jgi:AcrR family transcriptional regulator
MSYSPPPQPLIASGRRSTTAGAGAMPPFAAFDPEQRIIRAFAAAVGEQGYEATTVADVATAGRVSQSTFYAHFRDKADVMAAALDSSGAQLVAAVLPPVRRATDWPAAVRTVLAASCGFLAAEPAFAKLRLVGVYAAGPEATLLRDRSEAELVLVLRESGLEETPEMPALTVEAIVGAIYGTLYDRVRTEGSRSLPELGPLLTYVALAPFLGAERACEVANEG